MRMRRKHTSRSYRQGAGRGLHQGLDSCSQRSPRCTCTALGSSKASAGSEHTNLPEPGLPHTSSTSSAARRSSFRQAGRGSGIVRGARGSRGREPTRAGSRNSAAAGQNSGVGPSSYEYYEESEEEPDINSITGDAITSVQGGQKVPDKASSVINLQN